MAGTLIEGMGGLGDNFHQRAVVRYYRGRGAVALRTPWPQLYGDLGATLLPMSTPLRTQAKNVQRSTALFQNRTYLTGYNNVRVWYPPDVVRAQGGSVLKAMLASTGVPTDRTDFTFAVPKEWTRKALALIAKWRPTKPLMIYRPLVDRTEWTGCAARNPDAWAYGTLADSLRKQFFIVSVADLLPQKEWICGAAIPADVTLHAGELDIETLTALVASASLAFTSPGFLVAMSQAVGTPVVCVFGGYESSRSFMAGAQYAPYLGIDTVKPCECFSHNHGCEKTIDMQYAHDSLCAFVANKRKEQCAA